MSPEEVSCFLVFFFKVLCCNLLKIAADWTGWEILILRFMGKEAFAVAGFVTGSSSMGLVSLISSES